MGVKIGVDFGLEIEKVGEAWSSQQNTNSGLSC
jgi:hypothetical protein